MEIDSTNLWENYRENSINIVKTISYIWPAVITIKDTKTFMNVTNRYTMANE